MSTEFKKKFSGGGIFHGEYAKRTLSVVWGWVTGSQAGLQDTTCSGCDLGNPFLVNTDTDSFHRLLHDKLRYSHSCYKHLLRFKN